MNIQWRALGLWFGFLAAFIVEGTLPFWFFPGEWSLRLSPHLVLIGVLFAGVLMNRYYALALGLVFGLLQDVHYYGHMLGVHTFVMGLCGYLSGLALQRKFVTFFYLVSVAVVGSLFYDSLVYLCYLLFRVVREPFLWAFPHHIAPSMLLNAFLAVLLYLPVRQYMESMLPKKREEEPPLG